MMLPTFLFFFPFNDAALFGFNQERDRERERRETEEFARNKE
jgi:hypothetical protein